MTNVERGVCRSAQWTRRRRRRARGTRTFSHTDAPGCAPPAPSPGVEAASARDVIASVLRAGRGPGLQKNAGTPLPRQVGKAGRARGSPADAKVRGDQLEDAWAAPPVPGVPLKRIASSPWSMGGVTT